MEAKERRSGNPSSIAWKPAPESARNFLGKVCSSLHPIDTVAYEVGMDWREDNDKDIVAIFYHLMIDSMFLQSKFNKASG